MGSRTSGGATRSNGKKPILIPHLLLIAVFNYRVTIDTAK